jgi:E3 ubiquitin-protein ligase BRE1
MESRKRLGSETSVASSSRPAKRVATDPEQVPIQTDPFSYDDLTFINEFRREAIYRSLVAERRETQRLKERLKAHETQSLYHDDHIRVIDVWLKQLLEELAVSYGKYNPAHEGVFLKLTRGNLIPAVFDPTPPSVLLLDKEGFENHLAQHRQGIIHTVASLYQQSAASIPTDSETQNALKATLAKNNILIADVKRLSAEKDDRDDRLTDTMMRLLSLEKKLDRSKSITLAKIEAQAVQRAVKDTPEEEVAENGEIVSRPSSRVNSPSTASSNNVGK